MNDENQSPIPRSFIDLFLPNGRARPTEAREFIAARYELCEDMAQLLTEHARSTLFALEITEEIVLERILRGLLNDASIVGKDEARWIACRLAELLEWPMPQANGRG